MRWKPTKRQKEEFKRKIEYRNSLSTINSNGPVRNGCYVKYYSLNKDCIIEGFVINSSYGVEKGQHTFTIDNNGEKVLVKGRNLYPNLLEHIPVEISKQTT